MNITLPTASTLQLQHLYINLTNLYTNNLKLWMKNKICQIIFKLAQISAKFVLKKNRNCYLVFVPGPPLRIEAGIWRGGSRAGKRKMVNAPWKQSLRFKLTTDTAQNDKGKNQISPKRLSFAPKRIVNFGAPFFFLIFEGFFPLFEF